MIPWKFKHINHLELRSEFPVDNLAGLFEDLVRADHRLDQLCCIVDRRAVVVPDYHIGHILPVLLASIYQTSQSLSTYPSFTPFRNILPVSGVHRAYRNERS